MNPTCAESEALLSSALDTPLDAAPREALDAHLESCPACVTVLTEGVLLRNALREMGIRERSESAAALAPRATERFVRAMSSAFEAGDRADARRMA